MSMGLYLRVGRNSRKGGESKKRKRRRGEMEIERTGLSDYLNCLRALIGDERTVRTVRGVVEGIIASETLRCSQIVAFSPYV
jgi:hypothetical protein